MMSDVVLLQRPAFKRAYKKLHANQREVVNVSIRAIVSHPQLGEQKCGDLADVWVYKFDCVNQQYLMAYLWDEHSRILLSLGAHENFYRDLKR